MKKVLFSVAFVAAFGLVSCGGPGMCDCVNAEMDDEGKVKDEDLAESCKEMEKEWKDKYKEASDDEKEEMMKEFEDCKEDDKDEE